MTDVFPPEKRSWIMSRVRDKDTSPERRVRSIAHGLGYRYRLHRNDLPGNPDIVFPSRKKMIFVHGCFWHGHNCRRGRRIPKANAEYWIEKIRRNVERDALNQAKLASLGWDVLVIWECETRDPESLSNSIRRFAENH